MDLNLNIVLNIKSTLFLLRRLSRNFVVSYIHQEIISKINIWQKVQKQNILYQKVEKQMV